MSVIVEADPEVLCDKRVQYAVEGRFCDSAISVREAALELVGRHISSHPDVALKVFWILYALYFIFIFIFTQFLLFLFSILRRLLRESRIQELVFEKEQSKFFAICVFLMQILQK